MRTILKLIVASLALNAVIATKMERQIINELAEIESGLHEGADIKPSERTLAEKTTVSRRTSSSKSNEDKYGIGAFVLGCIMIPFSLVLLWKNEKKLVTYAKVIEEARSECVTIEADTPADENDFKLVHCMGTTENAEEITD